MHLGCLVPITDRYCGPNRLLFAGVNRWGKLDPLQGGGLPPQISPIPSFSIMITTTWSKYAPAGGVGGGAPESLLTNSVMGVAFVSLVVRLARFQFTSTVFRKE